MFTNNLTDKEKDLYILILNEYIKAEEKIKYNSTYERGYYDAIKQIISYFFKIYDK